MPGKEKTLKLILITLGIIFLIFVPQIFNLPSYLIHLLVLSGIYIMLVQGLNILVGYVGELSLGHQAFLGIGAYTSALLSLHFGWSFVVVFLLSGLTAALVNWGISFLSLRLRGAYFIIVTIAFAEVIRIIVLNSHGLTGGPYGLRRIPFASIFGYEFTTRLSYYYLILGIVLLMLLATYLILNSRFGRTFVAIRENEDLAKSVGINVFKYALLASVIGAFFAGLAGSFYAHYTTFISTDLLGFNYMITMIMMLTVGGRGTFHGPIIGAILFTFLQEYLRFLGPWRLVVLGLILILAILYMPGGIGRKINEITEWVRERFLGKKEAEVS